MCFLFDCVCCEMMVFVVVGLFCCGGINSNGFDVGFGDILIGSLFCVGLCVREWFVIGWVHFLWVVGSCFV